MKTKKKRIGLAVLVCVLICLIALPVGLYFLGKYQLEQNAYRDTSETAILQDQIYYKDRIWKRKSGIYTLMMLGIDIRQSDVEAGTNKIGQSDAIMPPLWIQIPKASMSFLFRGILWQTIHIQIWIPDKRQTTLLYAYAGGDAGRR